MIRIIYLKALEVNLFMFRIILYNPQFALEVNRRRNYRPAYRTCAH